MHIQINKTKECFKRKMKFRTGTYTAFEMAIQKLEKIEIFVIPDVAKSIHDQRIGAIQNNQVIHSSFFLAKASIIFANISIIKRL